MRDSNNITIFLPQQTSCQLIQVVFFHTGDVEGLLKQLMGLGRVHHKVIAVEPHKPVFLRRIHVTTGVAGVVWWWWICGSG